LNGTGGPLGFNWGQVALSAARSIWATRLGTYLFQRVSADGSDSRFDRIKKSPPSFFGAFMVQAMWVSLCFMPILAVNSMPASVFTSLGAAVSVTDVVGILLYVGGLSFEVIADRQKDKWVQEKKRKEHEEGFLTRGLWSKSRHPNYFGESTLWTGIATTAAGVLTSNAGTTGMGLASAALTSKAIALLAAGISPAFVTFLLLKVSGVPLSEKKYDKRYGDREDYKKWKRETPTFFPKF
jgi:steroid 5-alpha reductase family enzyme